MTAGIFDGYAQPGQRATGMVPAAPMNGQPGYAPGMQQAPGPYQQAPMQQGGYPMQPPMQQGYPPQNGAYGPQGAIPQQMPMQGGSMFSGIKQAKMAVHANYLRAGRYLVRVDRVKKGTSRKKGAFVAIEGTILFVFDNAQGVGHRPGESATSMQMQSSDYFLGEIKAFIACALQCREDQIDEDDCERICSPQQPLAGFLLECENSVRTSQKGANYTLVRWKNRWDPARARQIIGEQGWQALFAAPNGQQAQVPQAPAQPQQAPVQAPSPQEMQQGYMGPPVMGYRQPGYAQPMPPGFVPAPTYNPAETDLPF